MKKISEAKDDDLRPEYDLRSLRVVARGPGRRSASTQQRIGLDRDMDGVLDRDEAHSAS